MGIFFAGFWGFFLLAIVWGFGVGDFFVHGLFGEFCFFHDLFGDLGIFFHDLFGDLGLIWISFFLGFVDFFAIRGIWGFVFFVGFVCGFGMLVYFVFFCMIRLGILGIWDLFGEFEICLFGEICLGMWGFGTFFTICLGIWGFGLFFSRFVWGFRDAFAICLGICFSFLPRIVWGFVFFRSLFGEFGISGFVFLPDLFGNFGTHLVSFCFGIC